MKNNKKNLWSAILLAALLSPLSAQAFPIGTFTGSWADDVDSEPPTNVGTMTINFLTSTETAGGFALSGLFNFVCTSTDEDDCGAQDSFTAHYLNDGNELLLEALGLPIVMAAIVLPDYSSFSGSFYTTDLAIHGTFRAARVGSVNVPEPATLTLLLAGLAGMGVARRRRSR